MSKKVEYLLVGSAPHLVQSFMRSSGIEPVIELDDTTYLVVADQKPLSERMNKVANLYTAAEIREKDYIPGVFGDKNNLAVRSWTGQLKLFRR